MQPIARNAQAEAAEVIGHRFEVRVLEPSPPAIDDGEWYADDPAVVGEVAPGTKVVTATSAGDLTWESLAREDEAVAEFARRYWLVSRPLPPVPEGLVEARADLNRLVFYVISPARAEATGKIALRATAGGFGTPFFGDDVQIRLEGTDLVIQQGVTVRHQELGSLAAAAEFIGVELDPSRGEHDDVPSVDDPHRPLAVNEEQAAFLADWFAFGTSVLEELRLAARRGDEVSRVQLWAEHFDPALEIGDAARGPEPPTAPHRATRPTTSPICTSPPGERPTGATRTGTTGRSTAPASPMPSSRPATTLDRRLSPSSPRVWPSSAETGDPVLGPTRSSVVSVPLDADTPYELLRTRPRMALDPGEPE